MIEIYKNELRIDEVVLKYATAEEMTMLQEIAKSIVERSKKECD